MTDLERMLAFARKRAEECRTMTTRRYISETTRHVLNGKVEAFEEMAATALRIQDEAQGEATEDEVQDWEWEKDPDDPARKRRSQSG